ncbi:hypothetical protein NLC35_02310 [Candidatus Aminicenantes bacterium AC-334-K16]|nr:hypothetical protein [Candidatus Aminicenantes bacterium AC-334-K16]
MTPIKPYQGNPGHWICGATHGNEFTGTEVCLFIIDKLVSGYGSDKTITRLVDEINFIYVPLSIPTAFITVWKKAWLSGKTAS